MAEIDEQLVQQVVEQVLATLRQRGRQRGAADGRAAQAGQGPAASGRATSPARTQATQATFQPAAGTCTGDYSKFPELAGRLYSSRPEDGAAGRADPHAMEAGEPVPGTSAERAGAQEPGLATPVLRGIVTAQQLQEAIAASPGGVAVLAHDARPTPLANDLIRQSPQKVRRLGGDTNTHTNGEPAPHASAPTSRAPADGAGHVEDTWLWWVDRHSPAVQGLTRNFGAQLRPSVAPRTGSGLVQVVRDLAQKVESGQVVGGLLFVEHAAEAVCYANRCRALRAVVGTCPEAVDQGVRELGANVLIIEHPYVRPEAMTAMTRRMLAERPKLSALVARRLSELEP